MMLSAESLRIKGVNRVFNQRMPDIARFQAMRGKIIRLKGEEAQQTIQKLRDMLRPARPPRPNGGGNIMDDLTLILAAFF